MSTKMLSSNILLKQEHKNSSFSHIIILALSDSLYKPLVSSTLPNVKQEIGILISEYHVLNLWGRKIIIDCYRIYTWIKQM